MKRPNRIAVDWDSTLAVEVWPGIGDWLPGAKEALYRLAHMYDEVVIFTLRTAPFEVDEATPRNPSDQYALINTKLVEARMPLNVWVWDRPYKPPCEFFIDDRNIEFDGDWDKALAKVAVRRVTNHQEERVEPRFEHDGPILCAPSVFSNADPGDEDANFVRAEMRTFDPESEPNAARVEETVMRRFETGATRNAEVDPDYHGFLSPLSLHAYGEYMHTHRLQADGSLRDSDNWQKGMPADSYVRSLVRHTHDVQLIHDGYEQLARGDARDPDKLKAHLAAIIFNAQGMLHELMKAELFAEADRG